MFKVNNKDTRTTPMAPMVSLLENWWLSVTPKIHETTEREIIITKSIPNSLKQ